MFSKENRLIRVLLSENGVRSMVVGRLLVFILASYLLLGCVGQGAGSGAARLYWPPPPNPPRMVHEATLRSVVAVSSDLTMSDRMKALAVGEAADQPGMEKPYDVAARHGLLAVSDTRAGVVYVFDLVRGRVFPIGWRGEGKLGRPGGVAIDNQDRIYVADSGRNVVVAYDGYGLFLQTIGKSSDFEHLVDVAVSADGRTIYALDRGELESKSHQIRVYSADGKLINTLGGRGALPGQFNNPTQIAVSDQGEIFVLDAGNFRVQVLGSDGAFLRMWGRAGQALGDLARPRGLAVDARGHVYITDSAFQNLQIFDDQGRLLLTMGEAGLDEPGKFALPGGVAVDAQGNIFIVDQLYRKVEVWRMLNSDL